VDRQVDIKNLILTVRGVQVLLDSDVAMLYEYETKNINRAAARNKERFPESFRFQLCKEEFDVILSLRFQNGTLKNDESEESSRLQFATLKRGQHRKYYPLT